MNINIPFFIHRKLVIALLACMVSSAWAVPHNGTEGATLPVESLSEDEIKKLHKAGIRFNSQTKKIIEQRAKTVKGISPNPVLSGLQTFEKRNESVEANPRLTSLQTLAESSATEEHKEPVSLTIDNRVTRLVPISRYNMIASLIIDSRVERLQPLSRYSFWDNLIIDKRVEQLTVLSDIDLLGDYFIDPRVAVLTPLSQMGFIDEQEAVEYIVLPEAKANFDEPRTYLRDIQTTLVSELLYDDNVFSTNTNQVGSWILVNDLNTSATLQRRNNTYLLSYSLKDGQFFDTTADNFTDHRLYGHAHQEISNRQVIDISGYVYKTHERRGAGLSEGTGSDLLEEPLALTQNSFDIKHKLGDQKSKLRLLNELRYQDLNYDAESGVADLGEYKSYTFSSQAKYRVGPRTDFIVDVGRTETDYLNDPVSVDGEFDSLDSDTSYVLAGISRDIGRRSSAEAHWGGYDRRFEDVDRADRLNGYWDVEFTWRPRTYSSFNFIFKRSYAESRGEGSFIESQEQGIAWSHNWARRLRTKLNFRYIEDEFVDTARFDERMDADFRLLYTFNDRLSISGGGRYHQRTSTDTEFEFEKRVIFLESSIRM